MMTAAIRTEIHVLRLLMVAAGPAKAGHYRSRRAGSAAGSRNLLQQATGLVGRQRVVVAVRQRHRGAELDRRRGLVALLQSQLPELEMAAGVDPLPPLERQRFPQLGLSVRTSQRGQCRPALVPPQGVLAEHSRPGVGGKTRQAVGQESLSVA